MKFQVLTLFPEAILPYLESSILGRAVDKKLLEIDLIQIRDFAVNEYGKVDDNLYGGGNGMLMMAEPIWRAWCCANDLEPDSACKSQVKNGTKTLFLSPRGRIFNHQYAIELLDMEQIILICGHYEGVDERVIIKTGAEEVSLGDFVLTGGELGALIVIDAISRLMPGVLSDTAKQQESHAQGILEEPHYTRPADWRGHRVPAVLLSGHEAEIERWRRLAALNATLERRPDLLEQYPLSAAEWEELLDFRATEANE
jgi:tRNA (guanine37-N1)-methyltransferase